MLFRSSTDISGSSVTFSANTWVHVAACRSSNTLRLFVNGALAGSGASTQTPASNTWYVGSNQSNEQFDGYIDDLRITKGVARYTAAFTPPVAPHPIPVTDANFGAVSLLLHMNGANASTYFPDHSYNALAVTVSGDAKISTTQSKFGGSSAYFDGVGDYLSLGSNAAFGFGTGDFTIEYWMYPALTGDANQVIVDARPSDSGTPWLIGVTTGGAIRYYDGTTVRTGGTASANQWSHVAWTRSGSVNRIYLNGTEVGTYTASQDFQSSRGLTIGCNVVLTAERYVGYIDSLRITKGIARYTAAFTPPTAQFPNS